MKSEGVSDRLVFPKGKQTLFMYQARERLGMSWSGVARLINVHPRAIRNWAAERNTISEPAAHALSKVSGITVPSNAMVKVWKEHLRRIGTKGGKAVMEKYGTPVHSFVDEENRREKWGKWWQVKGRFMPTSALPFNAPELSEELAEFTGIMLGDGGVSRYQLAITLHRYDDHEYSVFVRQLIKKLFHIEAGEGTDMRALADTIVISRVKMVDYACRTMGLVVGNKVTQQVDIPAWIKENKAYAVACVRGLFDTDGSVFTHKYTVKGKEYSYKKISFTNFSAPLLRSFYDVVTDLGINCRFASDHDLRIESKRDVTRFFQVVAPHNPKHLKRYIL